MSDRPLLHLVITVAFVTVAGLAAAQTEPLHGTVINKADNGVSSVRIVVRSPSEPTSIVEVTTDEDGNFAIPMENLRPGYEIHLHKDGYDDVVVPISPAQLVVAELRIVMQATPREPSPATPATPQATPTPVPSLVTSEARKKAVELYNEGIEAWEEAKSADDKGEIEEQKAALQLIRQSASLDPTFAEPLIVLSRHALKNQNWAEASRYSEDLIRIDPNDIDAVRTLYLCMVVMRHHHRIGDAARRLVSLDPNTITSIEDHARAFFTNEIYVMARAMYEVLTEISPDPANAYLHLGLCCAALGDVEGTRAAFEAFLEHAPENHPSIESVKSDLAALDEPAVPEALQREGIPGPLE
jgi:regulator of sirC expression with transglutaminase-like and TPR domain